MEFLTILLSSVLGLVASAGLVIDRTAENAIRSQFEQVEQLQVRVDNAPSYQLLQGKVERVRIAGRGLLLKQHLAKGLLCSTTSHLRKNVSSQSHGVEPEQRTRLGTSARECDQDIRIDTLELETDSIDLNPHSLRSRQLKLERPFQAGMRLVLTQQDINKALQSATVATSLRDLDIELDVEELGSTPDDNSEQGYNLVNPRVALLANNRLHFQVELREQGNMKPLVILVESGLGVVGGRQIELVKPVVYVNQEEVTDEFVSAIANNVSQKLDLGDLETYGIQARILQLNVNPQKLEVAAFLRLEPSSQFLRNR